MATVNSVLSMKTGIDLATLKSCFENILLQDAKVVQQNYYLIKR